MSLNQTQINEIFAAMGLPTPSSAVAASLEAISNTYDALNTIIDLPEVQTDVMPILAMFDLALGHDPTSATLASMVENNGNNIASIANQFVESQAFANVYNAGVLLSASTVINASNSGIITALFVNGLGHPPTNATLQGFFGLSLGQAFLEFTQSDAIASVDSASLLNIMELAAGIPPQAAPVVTQTFTLTTGSDTVTTADITAGTTNVTINARLVPPTGGQLFSQPTLQNGDVIDLTGSSTANVLNAVFAPIDTGVTITFGGPPFSVTVPFLGPNIISTPIQGVQTWNLSTTQPFTYVAINGGSEVSGVTTINMNNSAADSAIRVGVGAPGFQPLSAPVTTLGASNDQGDGELQVVVAASAMTAAANVAVQVNLNNVGASDFNGSFSAQDYPGGFVGNAFEVSEGPNQGWINTKDGVTSWTLNVSGSNYLYLGTNGSQAATSVTIDGGVGNLTLWGNGDDWQNVKSINAAGYAGNLILTGDMYTKGFLSDPASLTSLQGGSGNNIFDLSGMTLTELQAMTLIDGGAGGTNTVILANDVLDGITAALPVGLTDFTVIGDAGYNGPGSADPGTINWADLGTNATQLTFFGGLDNGGAGHNTLTVDNAPSTFTVNLQDNDFAGINWSFNAANDVILANNSLTINFGCSLNDDASTGVNGHWSVTGYDSITLDSTGFDQSFFISNSEGIGNFTATPTPGGAITLDVTGNGDITIGKVAGLGTGAIGTSTVSIDGGSIIGSNSGYLDLGITDASVIDDSVGGSFTSEGLFMSGPDSNTSADLSITGSVAGFNLMQGSLGAVTANANSDGAYFGVAGAATINGGNGGDSIFDTGGVENINLSAATTGGDKIFYSDFSLNNNTNADNGLEITNNAGQYSASGTQFDNGLATVTNFLPGAAAGDSVTFDPDSWGFGSSAQFGPGIYESITTSNGGTPAIGNSVFWTVDAGGNVPLVNSSGNNIDVIVFNPLTAYTDGSLKSAINGGTVGFTTSHSYSGNTYSMLFAFNNGNGTTIADVQFNNAGANTAIHVDHVQDLVDLVGVTTTALDHANVHFI